MLVKENRICDKCKKTVEPKNNTANIVYQIAIITEDNASACITALCAGNRHFLPTSDCEGSPSRAQYIAGQPRDNRGYEYTFEDEKLYRQAYEQLLKECN